MSKKYEKDSNLPDQLYGFEITTTDSCNFACNYCFERGCKPNDYKVNTDIMIKKIWQLVDSDWFRENFCGMKIVLWGGEPTVNMDLCERIIAEFEDDERFCFFLYTNGSRIRELLPTLIRVSRKPFIKESPKKFVVQVSYDGNPIHDMNRLTKSGSPTSAIVHEAIDLLAHYDINFGLKSTLPWEGFKYLPEIWDDIEDLRYAYGDKIAYSVTVDYHNVDFYSRQKEIEKAIIEIAQKEYRFYKEHGTFLSNLFKKDRLYCAAAKTMAAVNTEGQVFYCHGCFYTDESHEFKYTSIYDIDFVDKIRQNYERFLNNDVEPEECSNCLATMCLRCNVKKFQASKKSKHLERWFDYTAEKELCDYYKMLGKIKAALINISFEEVQ